MHDLCFLQEDEVPSDFQDYSLVTLVGVAAHLMHQPLGEGAGLELLAAKYGHDVKALDQVGCCWFVHSGPVRLGCSLHGVFLCFPCLHAACMHLILPCICWPCQVVYILQAMPLVILSLE